MEFQTLGRVLLFLGIGLAILGATIMLFGRAGFGSLPGDIRFQSGGLTCFFPIATMILLSVILTIGLNVLLRLFNR